MSANLNAAEVLQGVVSTPAALEAVLNQGAMIVNDYVITIEAVDGGYKLIARRGSEEQSMVILNGVDAPVPDIKITDVVHGHDVTITVGDVAKTFYIHDGVDAPVPEISVETVQGGHKVIAAVGDTVKSFIVKDGVDGRDGVDGKDGYTPVKGKDYFDGQPGKDGRDGVDGKNGVDGKTPVKGVDYFDGKDGYTPVKGKDYFDGQPGKDGISPVINVSDIENGHRVTITTDGDAQSFDVLNGKDGEDAEGGTVEVDPTLSIEGMAADAKATGDAVKPIAAILDTTTTNKIEWDGVIGDRLTVEMGNGKQMVHVSDFVPDTGMLVGQDITFTLTVFVEGTNSTTSGNGTLEKFTDDVYAVSDEGGPLVVIAKQAVDIPFNGATFVIPKAGVYFQYLTMGSWFGYITSVSSPLLRVHGGVKVKEEALPVYIDYNQHDTKSPGHILNRPFWPAWSPVLLASEADYDGGMAQYIFDVIEGEPASPVDGKRYTFCVNGKIYTGIAVRTNIDLGDVVPIPCIMIADEQDGTTMACFIENIGGMTGWIIVLSDPAFADSGTAYITIVEGAPDAHTKLSVPEDVIEFGEGMYVVYQTTNTELFTNEYIGAAVENGTEIVADVNGVETVYVGDAIEIDASGQIIPGIMLMCDGHIAAAFMMAGAGIAVLLIDENAMGGTGFTAKSIRVNYPGIFAKTIPAKKLSQNLVDGKPYVSYIHYNFPNVEDGIYKISCFDDPGCTEFTDAKQVLAAFESGRQIYLCRSSPNNNEVDYTLDYFHATYVNTDFIPDGAGGAEINNMTLGFIIKGAYYEVYCDPKN